MTFEEERAAVEAVTTEQIKAFHKQFYGASYATAAVVGDFDKADIKVNVTLEKKSTMLELAFKHAGTVNVPCDLTGEMFDLPVKGKIKLVVQFGEAFNNDNEELLILQHGEHQIDIQQYVYEMIVLSVPLKKTHPGIKDGTLQSAALEKLKQLEVKEHKEVK